MIKDNRFSVELAGQSYRLISVSGLSMQRSLIETRVSDSRSDSPVLELGESYVSHVVLRRYFDPADATFYNWYRDTHGQAIDVSIKLLNKNFEPAVVWKMWGCLPVSLSYSELTAGTAEPVIEEIEIACVGMEMEFR